MRLLFYLLLFALAGGALAWVRQGIVRDRFQNTVENLVDRQTEEAAGELTAFIQERVRQGLVQEWRFFIRFFCFRMAWTNVWACAADSGVAAPKNLPWEKYARVRVRSFFREPPPELLSLKLEKELDDQLAGYLNRIIQTGGGFAVMNCQGPIAEILKKRLFEPGAEAGLLGEDFEKKLGEVIGRAGENIEREVKSNPAFKKRKHRKK